MDIPEKLATVGNQDTRPRQTKQRSATEYVMNTTIHKTQCRTVANFSGMSIIDYPSVAITFI
jgi:hypothetical protein